MNIQDIMSLVKREGSHSIEGDYNAVELILEDHKRLKELISVMKDVDQDWNDRRDAAEEFAIQLVAHAKPEEEVLYEAMKQNPNLRVEAFEGETEHNLADQLLEEIRRAKDDDEWSAKVKVIAELVEHHIKEEESQILPDVEKELSEEVLNTLGGKFLTKKMQMFEAGGEDSPHERGQH